MIDEFIILKDGELKTYDKYEDIPLEFDNVVKFCPYFPPGPHTDEQHEEIDSWLEKFVELMKRQKK